ncbi:MAG: SH3 domain-containing protein [Bacteroidales bacterium]|nr:SH3 domain-containing protein [Bacteroidales bacterium]
MKHSFRIRLLFNSYLFFFLLVLACNSCSPVPENKFQSEIDRIALKYIADKREAICNITAATYGKDRIIVKGETTIPEIKSDIINALAKSDIGLIDSIIILPDTSLYKKCFGVVTLSVANLRKEPMHKSELVSQAILGTPVIVLKTEESWVLVRTPDKYISWTEKSSLMLMDKMNSPTGKVK